MDPTEDAADACCGCLCCEKNFGCCLGAGGLRKYKEFERRFWQQEIWALKVVVHPKTLAVMYGAMFVALVVVGVLELVANSQVVASSRVRYDNLADCNVGNAFDGNIKRCTVAISIDAEMKTPAIFYYGLTQFSQGARSYVNSYSFQQINGEFPAPSGYEETCTPLITPPPELIQEDGQVADPFSVQYVGDTPVLLPCGVLPSSLFNDTITLFKDEALTEAVQVSENDLIMAYESEDIFRAGPPEGNYTDATNELIESVSFAIWMRSSAFPSLNKPLYRLEEDLPAGTYYARIDASFPVGEFDGSKFIYMQSLSFLGTGRNEFLGIGCLVVAGGCALMIVFIVFGLLREGKRILAGGEIPEEPLHED